VIIMDSSGYNTKTVCRLTGLTVRQVDYWDRIHFIKPSLGEASGYGSVRRYSFNDLVQLKVAKTLNDDGISLQKIRGAVTYLKKNFPDVDRPLAEMRLVTDGKTVFVLSGETKTILDTLSRGQLVMAIAVGEIIETLKGAVGGISNVRRYKVRAGGKYYEVVLHTAARGGGVGGFRVECPGLAGCASKGETLEEALATIKAAIERHTEEKARGKRPKRSSA
jgi:DNA-binding transcriptional MerR regulator